MVNFIAKKLQVFISSTFIDLELERQAAVEAILVLGHIPAGMELFTAGDESQLEVIKQWIDESDIYLLILGGRYGSVEPRTGKSYTQLEYEYAIEKNKPLFACVIKEAALEEKVRREGTKVLERAEQRKLIEFRDLVTSKMVKFWSDHKDIKISINETISRFNQRNDLQGWVRPENQTNSIELLNEITRLSKENSDLRNELLSIKYQKGIFSSSEILDYENIWGLLKVSRIIKVQFNELSKQNDLKFERVLGIDLCAVYVSKIMKEKYQINHGAISDGIHHEILQKFNDISISKYNISIKTDFDIEKILLNLGLLKQIKSDPRTSDRYGAMFHKPFDLIFSEKFSRFNYWLQSEKNISPVELELLKIVADDQIATPGSSA